MLKKVVRIGILMVLVLPLFISPVGVKAAQPAQPSMESSSTWYVQVLIFDSQWNGDTSGDDYFGGGEKYFENWPEDPSTTIGELRNDIENVAGFPVLILALVNDNGGCGYNTDFLIHTSDSAPISDYPICRYGGDDNLAIFLVYRAPSNAENVRLTLYGYINGDNQSCVLWSLDGAHPVNVDTKCGSGAELVCTVKLVGKNLQYKCDGGYDWLGEQIIKDPKWLSWANNFASMNGKK